MSKKSEALTILIIVIAIVVIFIVLNTFFGPSYSFYVEKLDEEPDNYINISEYQMKQFPHLKEAILNNRTTDTTFKELNEVRNFLDDNDTRCIKYQNAYYKIRFVYSEGV